MPKLRQTEEQRRTTALREAVARGKASQGLTLDREVARALGISGSSFSQHQSKAFRNMHTDTFFRMARRLKFTGKELCAIAGIPYSSE